MSDIELRIGLEGIAIAKTKTSDVRGDIGQLVYCGHFVQELVEKYSFEATVYLLWYSKLPSAAEEKAFTALIASKRAIPAYMKKLIEILPKSLTPMEVLRTAISSMEISGEDWPPTPEQALEVLAKAPTIVTYYYNFHEGKPCLEPDASLGHAANYLYMLHHQKPSTAVAKALEAYLILSADHGTNASTFTARVIGSTRSDIVSSITGAMGALIGPLHGGAPSMVDDMLDAIKTEDNVEPWLRDQLSRGERLMGFGHRVYKTYDPRAAALRQIAQKFSSESHLFKLSLLVEKVAIKLLAEYKPGKDLYPNLEFWAAGVLRTVELPRSLYTPTFCIARIAGWSANCFEQAADNRLIRPAAIYVGPEPTTPPPQLPSFE